MEMPGTMMAGSVRDRSNGGGPRRVLVPVWAANAAAACWAALKKIFDISFFQQWLSSRIEGGFLLHS